MHKLMTALAASLAVVLFALGGTTGTEAQQHRYSTGGAQTPEAVKQSIPAAPIYRDFLPEAVDLSRYFPPVGDQGNMGSCVGWATAYAARAYYAMQVEHLDNTDPANIPSPGWIFGIIHLGDDCDGGAYIPDAMNALIDGSYSLADVPYDDTKCARPSQGDRAKATGFQIESYELVWDRQNPDLDKVKGALASGNPVVIIALLDASFFDLSPRHKIWHSDANKRNEGGHAITLVGFDDRSRTFKFINSWTTQWGDGGYGYMDYDTFAARVVEGYTMKMPGEPTVTLAEADFNPQVVEDTPPLIVRPIRPTLNPIDAGSSRDLGDDQPIDVGALKCGKVELTADADGNTIASGFVGTEAELDQVDAALKGKVDDNQVELAPWPACEVRLTLAGSLNDTDTPQVAVAPDAPRVGDQVAVGIQTPGFASYVYASYFSADGTVLNLSQPSSAALKAKPGHSVFQLGGEGDTSAFTVAPPVGDEMLLVVASEKPLFGAVRPDSETDRQFLSGLRDALLSGDAGRVTATLVPVTTAQ
jgi:hypothetical protein